ncbi:MAG: hypothetical protein AAGF85_09725 [Bacteroidota bacterium]
MKFTFTICFFLSVSSLLAQNNETPSNITNYTSLSLYSQLQNPLRKEYVYIDHFNKYIEVPIQPNLMIFGAADLSNSADLSGQQWMGTTSTSKFQFMNKEFESVQIYDLNGVLRQNRVFFNIKNTKVATFFREP